MAKTIIPMIIGISFVLEFDTSASGDGLGADFRLDELGNLLVGPLLESLTCFGRMLGGGSCGGIMMGGGGEYSLLGVDGGGGEYFIGGGGLETGGDGGEAKGGGGGDEE